MTYYQVKPEYDGKTLYKKCGDRGYRNGCRVEFSATATCVSEAYEYLQAIIKANAINFPRQAETLSEYMCILVKIQNGETMLDRLVFLYTK